jgi:glycosyltransferase involved in cell wall biosynthesis
MEHKNVLLATRPLVPPWDEASKNFAYFLGKEVENHTLTLLTTNTSLEGMPPQVKQEPLFPDNHFGLRAKLLLFLYLRKARNLFDITHYLFTPTKLNTNAIRCFAKPTFGKTIQTIATLREDLYSPDELRNLFFADTLVVYTDTTKRKLEQLGFSHVMRIYPGIDLDIYQPQPKDAETLKHFGFTEQHFIVSYVGEYARLGATDMLTDTFIDFFTKNPDTNIRLVFPQRVKNDSDKNKKEAVRKRFADAGLSSYVAFPEKIKRMSDHYNASDIILFPVSNLHGKFDVPIVIIEAYACGKPVILSDLPAFQEFANDDICVTIPKDSGTELINKVAYLKDNSEECTRLGSNARRFVKEHFDLKNTAKQYSEVYNSL